MHTISNKKLLMLKVSQIEIPQSFNERQISQDEILSLSESITLNGIIQPIIVRKNRKGNFELVAGYKRLKGAVTAHLRRVPCLLHDITESEAALFSAIENLKRKPLHYFEEAGILNQLTANYGLTCTEICIRLGISPHYLSGKLRLLNLRPEIREKITLARLDEFYPNVLLLLPEYQQYEVLNRIVSEKLSIPETEILVNSKLFPNIRPEKENVSAPAPQNTSVLSERQSDNDRQREPASAEKEGAKPLRKYSIGDVRLFANSLAKLTDTMKSAGIKVSSRRTENEKYIEYKVRITKEPTEPPDCKQLKIC